MKVGSEKYQKNDMTYYIKKTTYNLAYKETTSYNVQQAKQTTGGKKIRQACHYTGPNGPNPIGLQNKTG